MSGGVAPLAGFRIGVTAARRADELCAMLERRGATVLHAPALRIVPLPDDAELLSVTRAVIAAGPDVVVATTGIGFRGWVEAVEGWGLAEELLGRFTAATMLARGPKARGAIRAAGLVEEWSPASESSAEVLEYLLERGVAGRRVVVQLHGEPLPGFTEALRRAGAEVTAVPVYRWLPPADPSPLDRLLDAIVTGGVDAVTFTSAPAVDSLLTRATERHRRDAVVAALRGDVLAACVGPVTAGPLHDAGVPTVQPHRYRLGALVRRVADELPARAADLTVAGHRLELRGQAALVDGDYRAVSPAGMTLLRALARRPGAVVSRTELLAALPGSADTHAIDTAITRLRAALGVPGVVRTVVKRGYRLAVDPGARPAGPEPVEVCA